MAHRRSYYPQSWNDLVNKRQGETKRARAERLVAKAERERVRAIPVRAHGTVQAHTRTRDEGAVPAGVVGRAVGAASKAARRLWAGLNRPVTLPSFGKRARTRMVIVPLFPLFLIAGVVVVAASGSVVTAQADTYAYGYAYASTNASKKPHTPHAPKPHPHPHPKPHSHRDVEV